MKKIILLTISVALLAFSSSAQAPEEINYQAVARDGSGNLLVNATITARMTVLSGVGGVTQEYQETHNITTNQYGLFDLKVGAGTVVLGDFSTIDWGSGEHHLQVEIDNGSGYVNVGQTKMLSVPYSLNAKTANGIEGVGMNDLMDVNTSGVTSSQVLKWNGTDWVPGNDNIGGSGGVNVGTTLSGDGTGGNVLDIAQQGATNGQILSWDGSSWVPFTLPTYTGGTGISVSGTTITNSAPDQTVSLTGNGATSITGTYPNFTITSTDNNTTYTGGTGISVSGTTITNSAPDQTVSLTGNGATSVTGTYPNFTISSTDNNTTYTGGSGISVSGTTISNSAPDQTVSLTGSGSTSVSGTYPNFTISSTDNNTTYTGGSGISVSGTTISNSAPDQTVSLIGSGSTSVSGTYPNFTISSTDNNTTYTPGSGIDILGTTIINSAPDQTVSITGTGAATVTGTYPNFTINATGGSTTYTGGTGINVSGTTITNSAPDQIISISGNGATMVTGTYPNFEVTTTYNAGTGLGVSGNNTFFAQNNSAIWNANRLRGRNIAATAPTNNQVLAWNGSAWAPKTISTGGGSTYSAGTGLTLSGTTFNAQSNSAIWNANKLRGRNISATAPSVDQVLGWNGSQWTPFSLAWEVSGTDVFRDFGSVGIGVSNPDYRLQVAGSSNFGVNKAVVQIDATGGTTNDLYTGTFSSIIGTIGVNRALYGQSIGSNNGRNIGVYGFANNSTNFNFGVQGAAEGNAIFNTAVIGFSTFANSTGDNEGIFGQAEDGTDDNSGVVGVAGGPAGSTNYGVFGFVSSGSSGTDYAGYFNGDLAYIGALTNPSDSRLKKDIKPLASSLDKIIGLKVYTYKYSAEGEYANLNLDDKKQFGFIAQELETVFPNLIYENKVPDSSYMNDEGERVKVEGGADYKSVNHISTLR